MKLSASLVVVYLMSSACDAFVAPNRGFVSSRVVSESPALAFAPKGTSTTESFLDSLTKLDAATMEPSDLKQKDATALWGKFANWITSTENRLYIGWFGTLMIPTLLTAATCFILAMIAAPPGTYHLLGVYSSLSRT